MPAKIDPTDIVGNQYGKLTVVEVVGKKFLYWMYRCRCSCGKETVVARTSLMSGCTKSCGHLKFTTFDPQSIIGQKYGHWTIEEFIGRHGTLNNHWRYRVRCDCGNTGEADLDALKRGSTTCCGRCYDYDIKWEDDHYRYYCPDGDSFIFDKDDYDIVSRYSWKITCGGYPYTWQIPTVLSRLLLDVRENEYVDHINIDTRDNRRENLRVCTRAENNQNKYLQKSNTSGFKGVSFHRRAGKFSAQICKDNKCFYLGLFPTEEDAALAYDEMAREFHGKFARLNFPAEGERGCRKAV